MESNLVLRRAKDSLAGYGDDTLSWSGVSIKTFLLFLIMIPTFMWAWQQPAELSGGIWIGALIGSFVFAILAIIMPKMSLLFAPLYAVLEGALLGGISNYYNAKYPGIAFQAASLSVLVFGAMWFCYTTGLIKVTEKFKSGLLSIMVGILLYYIAALITPMFGFQMPLIHDSGWMGIAFSAVICVVAGLNFLIDFDLVDSLKGNAPKYMEWYCGLGIMITFVWLYLELLRLLYKIKD